MTRSSVMRRLLLALAALLAALVLLVAGFWPAWPSSAALRGEIRHVRDACAARDTSSAGASITPPGNFYDARWSSRVGG
jgi:hypothetical protein